MVGVEPEGLMDLPHCGAKAGVGTSTGVSGGQEFWAEAGATRPV